jgi:hypothetical protein
MGGHTGSVDMGVIICKHCDAIIDTLDTEKVITYYADCRKEDCMDKRAEKEKEAYEC